jgi:hypothetical protein
LPRVVFFPDVPVCSQQKQSLGDVTIKDGIHSHGIMAVTREGRMKEPLHTHF